MLVVVGVLMTVPYGLSRLRGAEQYEPPRDAFVVVPQKLSTVLWVMIFWRSLLSVGDELMTRVWNAATRRWMAAHPPPPPWSIRSRRRSSTRSTTTPAGGRATPERTEPDDARLERRARADRQLGVGVPRGAPALGRRARIEQQEPVAVLAHGQVGVAEADGARVREAGAQRARAGRARGRDRGRARSRTPPISTVCSSGSRAATSQPSQLPATPSSGASAASSSSSATSVTSPVCRMRSASAQAASSAGGQRPPAPRPAGAYRP